MQKLQPASWVQLQVAQEGLDSWRARRCGVIFNLTGVSKGLPPRAITHQEPSATKLYCPPRPTSHQHLVSTKNHQPTL